MKNKVASISLSLFLLVFLGGSLLFLLFPFIADSYLLPRIIRDLPFDEKKLSISRITPWTMQGTLAFAHHGQESFSIASVEANYSPASLIRGRILSATVKSALLQVDKSGNSLSLRGLPQRIFESSGTKEAELPVMPLNVERFNLKNAMVAVHENDETEYLLVNATLVPTYERLSMFAHQLKELDLRFNTQGIAAVEGSIEAESEHEGYKVSMDVNIKDVGQLFDKVDIFKNAQSTGNLKIHGKISTEGLRSISGYDIQGELADFSLSMEKLLLESEESDSPVRFRVQGNMEHTDYELTGLEVHQPEQCSVDLDGQFKVRTREISGHASFMPARTKAAVDVDFDGNIGRQAVVNYTAKGARFELANGIKSSSFLVKGAVEIAEGSMAAKIEAELPEITDHKHHITLSGLTLYLPFNYPPLVSGDLPPGKIYIDEIRYKGERSGKLKGSLRVHPDQLQVSANMTTPFIKNFRLSCSGEISAQMDLGFQCSFPETEIDSEHLPKYVEIPKNLDFSGKIGGELRYSVSAGVQRGEARITTREVNVSLKDYTLTDLSGSLNFPKLPNISSSPSQLFTIKQIRLGKIVMSDAKVELRIDDNEIVFIEKAQLNWCGGLVEVGAVKLFENMDNVQTTLYCDRLQYTDLLSQFGIGDAEGGGSLNGRLPVNISREGIEFDNGFLFSTPGNSGIVRFKNTRKLRQGMAAMNKTVYLDYSMDALENFSYNWSKLTFNTEGEELLLALQLDGKPAEPLPYGYKGGQIAKSADGQGIQHPIRLDVNFRLPMRELFRYGKNIQSFMENM